MVSRVYKRLDSDKPSSSRNECCARMALLLQPSQAMRSGCSPKHELADLLIGCNEKDLCMFLEVAKVLLHDRSDEPEDS